MRHLVLFAAVVLPLAIAGCSSASHSTTMLEPGDELVSGEIEWHTVTPKPRPGTENVRVTLMGEYFPVEAHAAFDSQETKAPRLIKLDCAQIEEIRERAQDAQARPTRGPWCLVNNTKTAQINFGNVKKMFKAVTVEIVGGGPAAKSSSYLALQGFAIQITPEIIENGLRLSVEAVTSQLLGSTSVKVAAKKVSDDVIELSNALQRLRRAQGTFEFGEGEGLLAGPFDLPGKGRVVLLVVPRIAE